MNILTFDIEEWYIEKQFGTASAVRYKEYDRLLDIILEILDVTDTKATFFCLGKIASEFPHVITRISSCGHEIGCHSNCHRWVNKMTLEEFAEDTHEAVSALESVCGKKVISFRAPAFSICDDNKWAFEILSENGIRNDASIFPGFRDFGGFPQFTVQEPCVIKYGEIQLNEFPIPLCKIPVLGREIAYSGGGYFRLFPLSFIKKQITKSEYAMCYFHIADLLTEKALFMTRVEFETYFKESGSFSKRLIRYVKSNVGRGKALVNLRKLIESEQFVSIQQYLDVHIPDTIIRL